MSELKQDVGHNELEISKNDNAIELQEDYISKMKQNNEQLISANQEKIDKSNEDIASYNLQIADVETRIKALNELVKDFDQQQNKKRKLEKYEDEISKNLKKVEKEIEFYRQNTDCPVCKQTIDEDHR